MRERDVARYLVERVKALGGEVHKVKWIGRNGAPDCIVMLPGFRLHHQAENNPQVADYLRKVQQIIAKEIGLNVTIWVEIKAPGEKCRPHQIREHERMRRRGQRVEVVDSCERVDEVLA